MDTDTDRVWRKKLRRIIIACCCFVFILLIPFFIIFIVQILKSRHIARLEMLGYPVGGNTVQKVFGRVVSPEKDGRKKFLEAVKKYVDSTEYDKFTELTLYTYPRFYKYAALEKYLKENEESFQLLEQALEYPELSIKYTAKKGCCIDSRESENLRHFFTLNKLKMYEAFIKHDYTQTLKYYRNMGRICSWLLYDYSWGDQYLNIKIMMEKIDIIREVLNTSLFNDKMLSEEIIRLQKMEVKLERWIEMISKNYPSLALSATPREIYDLYVCVWGASIKTRLFYFLNRDYDIYQAIKMFPESQKYVAQDYCDAIYFIGDYYNDCFPQNLSNIPVSFMNDLSSDCNLLSKIKWTLRATQVGIATELYRRKYGKHPEVSGKLAPEFLCIPVDPFSGDPLEYIINKDRFIKLIQMNKSIPSGMLFVTGNPDLIFSLEFSKPVSGYCIENKREQLKFEPCDRNAPVMLLLKYKAGGKCKTWCLFPVPSLLEPSRRD